ncbi:hypothetical protein [Treponema pedis]|uniref:hypothetical protein n=1 Tax=Treponema pedis TaxID=409322 RepID=UPI003D1D615C
MKEGFFYKSFTEAEHPRDENGRFTEKGKDVNTREIKYDRDYVLTRTGSKDFGEISPDIAKRIKRQAGKIRLRIGKEVVGEKDNYGQEHIARSGRMEQLKNNGYLNVRDFVEDIAGNFSAIYQGTGNSLILYKKDRAGASIFIQLEHTDDDFYDVKTGMITRESYIKNKKLLWSKTESSLKKEPSEVRTPHTKQYPSAHSSGSSNDIIISQSDEKSSINKELQKTLNKLNEVFLPRIKIMEAYMGKKNRLNTITVSEVLKSADVQGVFDKALVPAQGRNIQMNEGDIDIEKLLKKRAMRLKQESAFSSGRFGYSAESMARRSGLKSIFYDPLLLDSHQWGDVHTISPYYGRTISYRILRRVAEKAWILNLCVSNIIKKIRPFLKPVTEENTRGFRIKKKAVIGEKSSMSEAERTVVQELEHFMLHTGDIADSQREDDLDKYVSKIIRDVCQLDQIAVELQRTRSGEVCAFWAVDPATVEVALPLSEQATGIKYVQVINNVPYAYYTRDSFIFDCMNPRTDIERSGYGYSVVEQAIDLITSSINTFMYNAGFFTENKLPRGLLLLNGDADMDEIEDIEDYIVNLMSGPPTSQWRIPIIPAGKSASSDAGRRFEWVSLQGTNKEMEFQSWFDLQLSGIVGIFGFSMEDLGLHSQKSAPLIGNDVSPKMESSKSLVLGDMLSFLQKHFNRILSYKNPDYVFEFVGYERSDPRLTLDIDKNEIETYKTIDEKRSEKGLKPFNEKWSSVPLNQQVVQIFQSEGASSGMVDEDEGSDDNAIDENQDEEKDIEAGQEQEYEYDGKPDTGKKNSGGKSEWDSLSKSINQAVKIVI